MKDKVKKFRGKANNGIQIVAVGALTGLFAGVIVTLYNALAKMCEHFASGTFYEFFRENPAFIPLLFLALFVGAIVIGGTLKFIPMIRGSGIPQTEGATRGLIRYKWYQVLPAMFACSLFTIFMGLSAGSEGPSIMIGGASGCGVSDILRRNATVRRYSITGGACAGLAVAFNAPLTGMAFAFEEAHKRFTPEVFVCAFSSVVFAILTRNLLGPCVNVKAEATFTTFVFDTAAYVDYKFYGFVLFAALICALVAVGFYFLLFLAKKLFAKVKFWKGMGKMLIPFLIGGAFALITVNVMGGGHDFISSLGSWEMVDGEKVYRGFLAGVERVFSSPIWATLLIVFVLKLILTVLNLGAGVPCGIFIPMLAVGAGLGALLSLLCNVMGMPEAYSDLLVMVCMATFFTTVVKAPITGIVMVVELTWNFTFLLPAILGVAIGYLIGDLFRTEPLYDKLLDGILDERKGTENEPRFVTARLRVAEGSMAAGRTVRDVLWPAGARIALLEHGAKFFVPDGNSDLAVGDILTVVGETSDEEEFLELLTENVGEKLDAESVPVSQEPPQDPPAPPAEPPAGPQEETKE